MNAIPCKRPKVLIAIDDKGYASTCAVPGCVWQYGPGLKTDVEQSATWHRRAHRDVLPEVDLARGDRGFVATCACGWKSYAGAETSRQSVEQTLAYHLSTEHGVVTCS